MIRIGWTCYIFLDTKLRHKCTTDKYSFDEESRDLLRVFEDVLTRTKQAIEANGKIDDGLYAEFMKIKDISVSAFEEFAIDELLWQINSIAREL